MKQTVKNKLTSVQHLITGIFLLLKGYDKIEHHYYLPGGVIAGFGALILFYYWYVKRTKRSNHALQLLVHLFEGLALLFTAYIFYSEGKTYLPYVTLAAGIGFLTAFCIHLKHYEKK